MSVNREATAKVAAFLRANPDVVAEIHRVLNEIGCAGMAVPDPFCNCCTLGNHDTMCDGTCGVDDCCHPLFHTDRDAAEEQRSAEVRERMRLMDAQDARVEWDGDPEQFSEPSEPLPIMDPGFIVHAFGPGATFASRCGADGGRRTVRRDAIECPECFELTRPGA